MTQATTTNSKKASAGQNDARPTPPRPIALNTPAPAGCPKPPKQMTAFSETKNAGAECEICGSPYWHHSHGLFGPVATAHCPKGGYKHWSGWLDTTFQGNVTVAPQPAPEPPADTVEPSRGEHDAAGSTARDASSHQ